MPACVVKWCRSHTRLKCPGINFHCFPADANRQKKWIAAVKLERQEYDWMPVKTSRVCSIHFDEKDFYKSPKGYTMLHKTAVPVCTMIRLEETSRNTTENENNTNERLQSVDENSLSAKFIVCDLPEQLIRTNTAEPQALMAQKRKLASTSATTSQQRDTWNKRKGSLPEAKTIIKSVYNYLQTEYQNLKTYISGSCDLSPLENILERTSAATGLSEEEVTAILEEGDSDDSSDESPSKRARVSQDYYDENISPIEEDSSVECADEAQPDNRESSIDIEDNPIETLKVEIDENVEYHSKPNPGILFQIPFSREQMSVLHQSLSLTEPTHTEVKQEPIDVEEQQRLKHLEQGDAVEDTGGEQDPLGESTSAVHHLLQSNFEETSNRLKSIKVECQDTEYPSSSTTQVGRRPD